MQDLNEQAQVFGWKLALLSFAVAASSAAHAQTAEFEDVATTTGLEAYRASSGEVHGPGAVFADLNNDSFPDLYLVTTQDNSLFINTDQNGQRVFVQAPASVGAAAPGAASGAVAGDYDNDGDVDIYVINWDEPNILLQNQLSETGNFFFIDAAGAAGVVNQFDPALTSGGPLDRTLTAAWADVNRDGHLDLYVGAHDTPANVGQDHGKGGQRDTLYLGNANGTFTDITDSANVGGWEAADGSVETAQRRYSSTNAVVFVDLNNDRWPDLWVTNKLDNHVDDIDMIYINQGEANGVWQGFETITYSSGLTDASPGAMGIAVADFDHDNDFDAYITDFINPNDGTNDFYTNNFSQGSLSFSDSNQLPALFSWGVQWEDFDNNGWEDIHVATHDGRRDFLYLNTDGAFIEAAGAAGLDVVRNQRTSVSADYDRDGWLDLFVVNKGDENNPQGNEPSLLFRNISAPANAAHHFITMKLVGNPSAPGPFASTADAIGARARLTADLNGDGVIGADETLLREVVSGSSNAASTSSLDLEFGIGRAASAQVEVLWPSGGASTHTLFADTHYVIDEASGLSQASLSIPAPISGGVNQLVAGHSALCLAAEGLSTSSGAAVQQVACADDAARAWSFQPVSGALSIVNHETGLCLEVAGRSANRGAAIIQATCTGWEEQLWSLDALGGDAHLIRSDFSGFCIDVTGNRQAPGTPTIQWTCTGNPNQQWSVVSVAETLLGVSPGVTAQPFVAAHSSLCLSAAGGSPDAGANIQQEACQNDPIQDWRLESASGGYMLIRNAESDLCLDVTAASLNRGANIVQWSCHGRDNQQWRLEPSPNGGNVLRNRRSNLCADVAGNSSSAGANILQWTCTGRDNQRWE